MNVTALFLIVLSTGLLQEPQLPRSTPPTTYDASIPVVEFSFERQGLSPPQWSIELYEDGRGTYRSGPPNESPKAGDVVLVSVSPSTHKFLVSGAGLISKGPCEGKAKNIANTGRKKLAYGFRSGDLHSTCTFNYSDSEQLNGIASAFQAIAETIQMGERLQHEHRFDRLSLDAEMQSLTAEVAAGRAIEVGNIAATLKSLVEDDRVMDRVRRSAARLLETAADKK